MNPKKEKKRLERDFIVSSLMEFYKTLDKSFHLFCTEKNLLRKQKSLSRIGHAINFFKLKEDNASQTYVYKKLVEYLDEKVVKEREKMEKLSDINKVLTDDEIALVVNTCKELSTMGLGIDEDTCLYICNVVIAQRIEEKEFQEVTRGVVSRIIKNNADLLKLCKGNSIDPKRVRQADKEVLQALFVKLDNMVQMLHSQGKVPWKSYADVPAESILHGQSRHKCPQSPKEGNFCTDTSWASVPGVFIWR